MRRRQIVTLAALLAIGIVVAVAVWRPWQTRLNPADAVEPDPPADTVAVTVFKRSGGPCGIEIRGASGGASGLVSASLAAGAARSIPLRFPAPYTVESVTVTRSGSPRRREVQLTMSGGRRYELLIETDDTVAVIPALR